MKLVNIEKVHFHKRNALFYFKYLIIMHLLSDTETNHMLLFS